MNSKTIEYLAKQVHRLPALPTLPPGPYGKASGLIEELLFVVQSLVVDDLPSGAFLRGTVRRLRKIGDPSAAEMVARRSARLLLRTGESADAIWLLSLAGLSCADQCLFVEAGDYFVEALSLIEHSDPHFLRSGVLSNYANSLTELEQFDRAEVLYTSALEALEHVPEERFKKARGMRRKFLEREPNWRWGGGTKG